MGMLLSYSALGLAVFGAVHQIVEIRGGVRVRRPLVAYGALALGLVLSAAALVSSSGWLPWIALLICAALLLLLLYHVEIDARLPEAIGLVEGQSMPGAKWRRVDSGELVEASSLWQGRPSLVVLYRGAW